MSLATRHVFSTGLIIAASFITLTANAKAASSQPPGITVSPAYQQVNIPLGSSSQPIKLNVTNHETKAETISISARDFNTLGETGGLFFVGSNPTQLQKKYGLAKWISLGQNQLTINPGQTATISASILNLPDLNPGGHYGAIMLSLNDNVNAGGKINIHPIASSLLFITKPQGATYRLSLSGVTYNHSYFSVPKKITLRFQNTGNTHVVPRGLVKVLSPSGKLVSKGIVNQNSNIILPQAYRLIYVPLSNVSNASQPGKYRLVVDFRFDGIDRYRRYQASLYILPLVIICSLLFIIFTPIGFVVIYKHRHKQSN